MQVHHFLLAYKWYVVIASSKKEASTKLAARFVELHRAEGVEYSLDVIKTSIEKEEYKVVELEDFYAILGE